MMNTIVAFWLHSLFILGGNYFGKHAFFKTCGAIISVILALVGLGVLLDMGEVWNFLRPIMDFMTQIPEVTAFFLIVFIFFCFTALNWWLSYKLFTRSQVIQPKFRLL
jgi:hypothetical protein